MPFTVRKLLALAALVLLSLAVSSSACHYTRLAIAGATVALVLALAACSPRAAVPLSLSRSWSRRLVFAALLGVAAFFGTWYALRPMRLYLVLAGAPLAAAILVMKRRRPLPLAESLLAVAALVLSAYAVPHVALHSLDVRWPLRFVQGAAAVGFGTVVLLVLLDLPAAGGRARGFGMRLALLFGSGAVLRVGVLIASPDPVIDIYSWLHHAPAYLREGINPYAAEYPSPYLPERIRKFHLPEEMTAVPRWGRYPAYPPLPILATLPFSVAGLDVRLANVTADLAAALILFLLARRRGTPLVGALAAAVMLHYPLTSILTESAWIEPMLAATLGAGFLLSDRGSRWGQVLLALGLTGKQFGIALLGPLWRAQQGRRWAFLLTTAAVGVGLCLPFFLWGPSDFLASGLLRSHGSAGGPGLADVHVRGARPVRLGTPEIRGLGHVPGPDRLADLADAGPRGRGVAVGRYGAAGPGPVPSAWVPELLLPVRVSAASRHDGAAGREGSRGGRTVDPPTDGTGGLNAEDCMARIAIASTTIVPHDAVVNDMRFMQRLLATEAAAKVGLFAEQWDPSIAGVRP